MLHYIDSLTILFLFLKEWSNLRVVQSICKLNSLKNIKKIVKNNLNFKIGADDFLIIRNNKVLSFCISLFTCTIDQITDEDTSDESDDNTELLDEMSQTLENLLREQNIPTSISNEVENFFFIKF